MNKYEAVEKRETLDSSIDYSKKRLQEIVEDTAKPLDLKRILADVNITSILRDALPLLSKRRQREIQACLDLREQLWTLPSLTSTATQTDGSLPTLQAE